MAAQFINLNRASPSTKKSINTYFLEVPQHVSVHVNIDGVNDPAVRSSLLSNNINIYINFPTNPQLPSKI